MMFDTVRRTRTPKQQHGRRDEDREESAESWARDRRAARGPGPPARRGWRSRQSPRSAAVVRVAVRRAMSQSVDWRTSTATAWYTLLLDEHVRAGTEREREDPRRGQADRRRATGPVLSLGVVNYEPMYCPLGWSACPRHRTRATWWMRMQHTSATAAWRALHRPVSPEPGWRGSGRSGRRRASLCEKAASERPAGAGQPLMVQVSLHGRGADVGLWGERSSGTRPRSVTTSGPFPAPGSPARSCRGADGEPRRR